jgi:hypothetical protein
MWYDWLLQDWELVIYNADVLKTDTQLKKIREQANKWLKPNKWLSNLWKKPLKESIPELKAPVKATVKAPEGKLVVEARKYNSADEFYNRASKEARKDADRLGIRWKSQYETFYNKNVWKKKVILDTLNPTWWLGVEYTPKIRATAELWPNITTLDKTMEVNPNVEIIIYRGAPKSQKNIVPWDFVTTSKELANSYTDWNVIEMKVKAKDILDDITEPLWLEYIYRPNK